MSTGTNLSDESIVNGGTFDSWLGTPPGGPGASGSRKLIRCTTANLPSAVAGFALGCMAMATDTGIWYSNTGTVSSCTFTKASIVATGNTGYYVVSVPTNGTTAVNVFGATNGFAGTITNVLVTGLDGTAANIGVADTAGTVVTVAKGTSSGLVTGGTTLSNTAFTSAGTLVIVSTSATAAGGAARVLVTFTVA